MQGQRQQQQRQQIHVPLLVVGVDRARPRLLGLQKEEEKERGPYVYQLETRQACYLCRLFFPSSEGEVCVWD